MAHGDLSFPQPDGAFGPPPHSPTLPPGFRIQSLSGRHPALDTFSHPFQSVVGKLNKEYSLKPSAATYVKAIHALHTNEIRLLAKGAVNIQPLSLDERRSFVNGVKNGLASTEGKDYMEEAAIAAADGCTAIKNLFNKLGKDLKDIDDKLEATGENVAPFAPLIKPLQRKYDEIVDACKKLASKVSIQGKKFDTSIIAFAAADGLDNSVKLARIEKYIDEATQLSSDADAIVDDLDKMQKDFSKLTTRFRDFSKQRQPGFHAKIETVQQQLDTLDKKLKDLKLQLTVVTASAGVVGTLTTGLAAIFAPASAFILASGLLATAGLGVYAAVLAAQIEEIEREKKTALTNLNQLTAADAAYREAMTALVQLSRDSDETLAASIELVPKLLKNVSTDAEAIKEWLVTAGDDAALPEAMGTDLKEAGQICE
ncbi:hypothetical protein ABEF95_006473 [Exophiala dermatitidis]